MEQCVYWSNGGVCGQPRTDDIHLQPENEGYHVFEGVLSPEAEANGEYCRRCGGRNVSWSTASPLWNYVMRNNDINGPIKWADLVCIPCFIDVAVLMGLPAVGWRLTLFPEPDGLVYETPSGRIWNPKSFLWEEAKPAQLNGRIYEEAKACMNCGVPVKPVNFAMGEETMHYDPASSFPSTQNGGLWKHCKTAQVATLPTPRIVTEEELELDEKSSEIIQTTWQHTCRDYQEVKLPEHQHQCLLCGKYKVDQEEESKPVENRPDRTLELDQIRVVSASFSGIDPKTEVILSHETVEFLTFATQYTGDELREIMSDASYQNHIAVVPVCSYDRDQFETLVCLRHHRSSIYEEGMGPNRPCEAITERK